VTSSPIRLILCLAACTAAVLAAAGPVLADGDPASDYLLGRPLFTPPDAGIPAANAAQLTQVIASAKAAGYPIRVALIGSRYDLGSVYELWQHPKLYARFLSQELKFVYKGRLLVVMPNGYGTAQDGKAVPAMQAVVDRLPLPQNGGAGLSNAAARAVQKLAAQSGAVVTLPALSAAKSTTSSDRLTIAVAAGVLVLLAAAGVWLRRLFGRRRVAA
jgi:hypothetical protein